MIAGVPPRPVFTREKSCASTPVTGSLKITVQLTLLRFVGDGLLRLIETTWGAVVSVV